MFRREKRFIWIISIGVLILLLGTNLLTFFLVNIIKIENDEKIVISTEEYNNFLELKQKYRKSEVLQRYIKENYLGEIDEKKLMEGTYKGMFSILEDPYSLYMSEDEFKDYNEHTSGIYIGIGVIITPGDDNLITVVSPIEGTPAERAGLKTNDKIIKVNDQDFTAEEMNDAINVIKGEEGTDVKITILRRDKYGKQKEIDLTITREKIKQISVRSQVIDNNIGYIRIISFDKQTADDFKVQLKELENQKIKGLIIDLRNNPGGLLEQCAQITDTLMGEGTIVYTETKDKQRQYLKSDKDKIDIPVVVLRNGGSASASEILAGALKDTNSGTLVGTRTFGKGIVQTIKPYPQDGSGFKLTISEYFTPNGLNIHGIGIEPHFYVELPDDIERIGVENLENDTQLKKAVEIINDKNNQ